MENPCVHIELNTSDTKRAKKFYSSLFKWELEDVPNQSVPDGIYTVVKVGAGTGGGNMKKVPNGPSGWLPYVEVDNIHDITEKARTLGAQAADAAGAGTHAVERPRKSPLDPPPGTFQVPGSQFSDQSRRKKALFSHFVIIITLDCDPPHRLLSHADGQSWC